MKTIKGKVLNKVEKDSVYKACTFYLEGEHCLEDCVFYDCSFRGNHFSYVGTRESTYTHPYFENCAFNLRKVSARIFEGELLNYGKRDLGTILDQVENLTIMPLYSYNESVKIVTDLPKVKMINLFAYYHYSKFPIDWFEKFSTLEKVILPSRIDDPTKFYSKLAEKNLEFLSAKEYYKDFGKEPYELGHIIIKKDLQNSL